MLSLWQQIIETSSAKIYGLLISVISLFLTARILGPDGRGIVAAVLAWVGLFASFAGLSLGQVLQYHIQTKQSEQWLASAFSTLVFLCFVLSAIAYLVAYFLFQITAGQIFRGIPFFALLAGFLMLPFLIWEDLGSHLLMAVGSLRTYNISQILSKTFGICAIVLLAFWNKLNVTSAVSIQVGSQIVLCFIVFIALAKIAPFKLHFYVEDIKALLKGAAKLHLNTVGTFLVLQSNILMLNQFATNAEVGWYQLAFQLITIMLVIPQSASMVFYSRMAEIGPDRLWPEQKKLGLQVLLVMILISCLAYFIIPTIITIMAGTSFEPSIKVFRLLLPALLGMTFSTLLANQWIGRGIFLPTTIITFIAGLINIAINFYTIPKYGIFGAVWSAIIAFGFFTVFVQIFFALYCEGRYRRAYSFVKPDSDRPGVSR